MLGAGLELGGRNTMATPEWKKKALSLVRLQVDVEPMPRILGVRQEYTLDETPVFYRTPWTYIFIHMGNLV